MANPRHGWRLSLFIAMISCAASCGQDPQLKNPGTMIGYGTEGSEVISTAAPIVMYDKQFFDTLHADYYLTLVTQRPFTANIEWSSNGTSAAITMQQPWTVSIPGAPAPTAAPGHAYIAAGTSFGKSIINASAQSVGSVASVVAYHYPSIALGCVFRYTAAYRFSPVQTATALDPSDWQSADIYTTASNTTLGPLDPCFDSALSNVMPASDEWHTPYGGTTVFVSSLQEFTKIVASQWRNDFTSLPTSQAQAIIFKTSSGNIVKAILPIGPFEVSDSSGNFPY